MKISFRIYALCALMLIASALGIYLRPTNKLSETRPQIDLAKMIPSEFADWHEVGGSVAQIIDPQQAEFINSIYKQTLTRTYKNSAGQVVMLSLAYVESQGDAFGVHLPEVCYPAQGFRIEDSKSSAVSVGSTSIPSKQMVAIANNRVEPLTYWTTVGDTVVGNGTQRKLVQIKYALKGYIPDGMLFRVSSISQDKDGAYAAQERFIQDLNPALPPYLRAMLYGTSPGT